MAATGAEAAATAEVEAPVVVAAEEVASVVIEAEVVLHPPGARRYAWNLQRPISEAKTWQQIVVERLSKNINEQHLHEIFGQFGRIKDLDLPMNRTFGTNRGTAYILYDYEEDAEAAIANMHEAQVDGSAINVSIVLPRRKLSPAPPTARRGANIDPRVPFSGGRGGPSGAGTGATGGGRRRMSPASRPPDPLHAVGAAGIAVALTTLTHLDRARDLQARDEKELVGTTITRRGVAVASIVMTAEVDLAVEDAVPGKLS
ncbi:hypothetical protein ACLX1H_008569 [Fusarium chlamydosporum]